MLTTVGGIIIRTRVADISQIGRNTQGVRIIRVDDGDNVGSSPSSPKKNSPPAPRKTWKPSPKGKCPSTPKPKPTPHPPTPNPHPRRRRRRRRGQRPHRRPQPRRRAGRGVISSPTAVHTRIAHAGGKGDWLPALYNALNVCEKLRGPGACPLFPAPKRSPPKPAPSPCAALTVPSAEALPAIIDRMKAEFAAHPTPDEGEIWIALYFLIGRHFHDKALADR